MIASALGNVLMAMSAMESPPHSLDYTSWLFVEIDGRATELTGDVFRDDRYAVDFGPDVLVGYGGCNRFTTRYVRSNDQITFTLLGSTRRACPEPAMSLEQRLFEILRYPLVVSFPDPDTMVLTGAASAIRLRRTDDDE